MEYYVITQRRASMKTLVMGVIGADVHAVGNKILNLAFTEAGYKVVNLGIMVSITNVFSLTEISIFF